MKITDLVKSAEPFASREAGTWYFEDGLLVRRRGDDPAGRIMTYQDCEGRLFAVQESAALPQPEPREFTYDLSPIDEED